MAISRYREFGIPVDWLLDSGVVGKVGVCFIYYLDFSGCHIVEQLNKKLSENCYPHGF